jgi:hypothetical protein
VVAELFDVKVDQAAPVFVFLHRHIGEQMGAGGIVLAQAVSEIRIDAAVLLFAADRQGEQLALAEIGKAPRRHEYSRMVNKCPRLLSASAATDI